MTAAGQTIPLLLFVMGALFLIAAYRLSRTIHPTGHVDQVDESSEAYVPHGLLILAEERLAGQPHGLLRRIDTQEIIPVQVIDTAAPDSPDEIVSYQMAALCHLVESTYDQAVPCGMLRYSDLDSQFDWTPENRRALSNLLSEMRTQAVANAVERSHDNPSICATCAVKDYCDQTLA